MNSEIHNKKQTFFKAYGNLFQLEKDLRLLQEQNPIESNISVLGKTDKFYRDTNLEGSIDENAIKLYWEKVLGYSTNFGSFINPELGNVFIIGALASSFLYALDGKTLGMLSAGPFGILRGIGATKSEVDAHLKKLYNDNYVLIFRGFPNELKNYKKILEAAANQ